MFGILDLSEACIAKPLHGNSTGSVEATTITASWIRQCDEEHEQCKTSSEQSEWCPTRLLHVGNTHTDKIRLIVTSKEGPSNRYMTLSHCWGTRQPLKLLRETEASLLQGIELNELPQTFQDAVTVTRRCNISYLWIDSLCIRQDEEADWNAESLLMEKVYSSSYLNISADWGSDSSAGLFHTRDPIAHSLAPLDLNEKLHNFFSGETTYESSTAYQVVLPNLLSSSLNRANINTRGWVVQERYLSPRVLHFGQKQLFWECRQSQASESFPFGQPPWDSNSNFKQEMIILPQADMIYNQKLVWHTKWRDIVELYSRARLTKPGDKLIAISGIAKYFTSKLLVVDDMYMAGIWRRDLHTQLLWLTLTRKAGLAESFQEPHRPIHYRAPTWSWAAVDGAISFPDRSWVEESEHQLSILDVHLTHTSKDVTGPVTGGYMEIRGRVGLGMISDTSNEALRPEFRLGTLIGDKAQHRLRMGENFVQGLEKGFPIMFDAFHEDFPQGSNKQECAFYFLLVSTGRRLSTVNALVLEPVTEETGTFRRVGIAMELLSVGDVRMMMDVLAQGGENIPCREYKDGLHMIRIM